MHRQYPPDDWKERLVRILSQEGITEPPHRASYVSISFAIVKWAVVSSLFLVSMILSMAVIGVLEMQVSPTRLTPYLVAGAWLVLLQRWILPWLKPSIIEARGDHLGRRPTHILMRAKHPPVLYLRSFHVDKLLADISAEGFEPSLELTLVARISRHACVLAIGRPGEPAPPPGAARFYVPDGMWQTTVAAVAPLCQLVVWTTGHTESLHWEIKHLVKNLPPRQLLLWLHVHFVCTTREQRNSEWQRFLMASQGVFPKPLPDDIDNVHFLAFKEDWTPEPLTLVTYHAPRWARGTFFYPRPGSIIPFLKERLS